MNKKVEVIIPSYKPDMRLRLLLMGITEQSYPVSRVHIINTEQRYWQEELLPDMGDIPVLVTHISIEEFDHGGTRRMGAAKALADFLLFMTQDAVPADERLIERLVEAHEAPESMGLQSDVSPGSEVKVAVAYARQLPVTKDNFAEYSKGFIIQREDVVVDEIECYTRQFNYPKVSKVKTSKDIKSMGIKAFFCSDVCAMYNREYYEEVGGFVRPTMFNEDMIFAADAINKGFAVVYAAEALVYHSHRYSLKALYRRNYDIGISQMQYADRFEGISSEKEGVRFVLATAKHLVKTGYFYLLPRLVLSSAAKYAGYFFGKRYWKKKGRSN